MGLSYFVEAVDKHSGEKCLNLNVKKKKNKLMKTDKTKEDRQIEIKANGEISDWVSKYVYLGSTISGDEMGWRK